VSVRDSLPEAQQAIFDKACATVGQFSGYLSGPSFEASMVHTAPYAMGAFALCAALSMLLPRTAVSEEALTES